MASRWSTWLLFTANTTPTELSPCRRANEHPAAVVRPRVIRVLCAFHSCFFVIVAPLNSGLAPKLSSLCVFGQSLSGLTCYAIVFGNEQPLRGRVCCFLRDTGDVPAPRPCPVGECVGITVTLLFTDKSRALVMLAASFPVSSMWGKGVPGSQQLAGLHPAR